MTGMLQTAPWPEALEDLVAHLEYRPGWKFSLAHIDRGQGSTGLTLIITTRGYDTYHPDRGDNYRVNHYMPVPPASYDARSWQHWLFEQLLLVERHECMEFFQCHGTRPYAPAHGPGNDPYLALDYGTEDDRRTSFRGELNLS
jgi:hypothetical protein